MALSFSDYSGGQAAAPMGHAQMPAQAQAGGRRRRGRRTAKKSSKKWFAWKGGVKPMGEDEEKMEEEKMEEDKMEEDKMGGKRRRRKSVRKSRKSRKSRKMFGLF